jgi:hypothetical protein
MPLTDRLEGMLYTRDEALLRHALPRSSASQGCVVQVSAQERAFENAANPLAAEAELRGSACPSRAWARGVGSTSPKSPPTPEQPSSRTAPPAACLLSRLFLRVVTSACYGVLTSFAKTLECPLASRPA